LAVGPNFQYHVFMAWLRGARQQLLAAEGMEEVARVLWGQPAQDMQKVCGEVCDWVGVAACACGMVQLGAETIG
jgi:hypothetical protein